MGVHYENLDDRLRGFVLTESVSGHPYTKSVAQPLSKAGILHSPEQFRAFLEHAPIGIAIAQCDDFCFVLVNRTFCQLVGYSEAELLTLNCQDITHPEDLSTEQPLAEALINGDIDTYQLDKRFLRADGSYFWGHLTTAAVRDERGRLLYVSGMVLDITERRHHQELLSAQMAELERLQQLKDDFLSAVSHELRTPLTNMRLALHMLDQPGSNKNQSTYMELLKHECKRELELVNDLLDLQRLESCGIEPQWCNLSLQQCLNKIAGGFVSRLEAQNQRLSIELPADLPLVRVDRAWLERIIAELLTNACKYAPPGSLIAVRILRRSNHQVQIAVGNDGPTIADESLPYLFDKFYRVPKEDLQFKSGTGLGLALVRGMVERMGGTICVESHSNWTEFTVTLPMANIL
ncbi:MAG: PAS domain S-box protein [Anaerolineae bacterium]|nr:PAS domain S-box protein [Gloeobacterales cyanobacterium ES-bin-313]